MPSQYVDNSLRFELHTKWSSERYLGPNRVYLGHGSKGTMSKGMLKMIISSFSQTSLHLALADGVKASGCNVRHGLQCSTTVYEPWYISKFKNNNNI